jgi:membrane protein DedA with SNARE-associated domain
VAVYFLILLSIIIEGEVALIVIGILAHTKIIPLEIGLTLAVSGATIKTVLGYLIGAGIKKYIPQNKIFDFIEKRVLIAFPHFKEKPFWSLFFSKFIYGLNHFTIIFAGYTGSKLRTYITAEVVSSVAWITIMFSIGYFFSRTAFAFSHDLKRVALYLLLGIIAFLLVERIVGFIIEYFESEE